MLYGEKIYLRRYTKDELDIPVRWFNDLDVVRYMAPFAIYGMTMEDELDWYERMRKSISSDVVFGIVIKENEKLIGGVGLHRINREWRNAEIGIILGEKDEWNKGYATEAMKLMMKFGFDQMNLDRIYLYVCSTNKWTVKCYENIGFKKEGTLRKHRYTDGVYHDEYVMGILKDEI